MLPLHALVDAIIAIIALRLLPQVYNMANLCELNRYQIYREVKLHSNLQHENIITLFAAFKQGDQVRVGAAMEPIAGLHGILH